MGARSQKEEMPMRRLRILVFSLLFVGGVAKAEIKIWDDLLAKAASEEKNDLGKILQQIRMVSAKDPRTGQSVFKVVAVEKGSVFDREGVKVGDLLYSKSETNSGMKMELKNSVKPTVNTGKTNP